MSKTESLITVREMTIPDLPEGERLCRIAGWNQLEADWKFFIENETAEGFVAVNNGNICGTAAIVNYENICSWIGMVLVDPGYRRMGIGTKLMDKCIESLENQNCAAIKLDATPMGKKVYDNLGFKDEYMLSRMIIEAVPAMKDLSPNIKQIDGSQLEDVVSFDEKCFGARRGSLIKHFHKHAPEYAFAIHDNCTKLKGFSSGRHGHNREHIGPVVADNFQTAKELVSHCLANAEGKPALIDIPHKEDDLRGWLEGIGFVEERSFIRMFKGKNITGNSPSLNYAIAGPEFG